MTTLSDLVHQNKQDEAYRYYRTLADRNPSNNELADIATSQLSDVRYVAAAKKILRQRGIKVDE